jgi:hypothetical protein
MSLIAPVLRQVLIDRILQNGIPAPSNNNKIGWACFALSGLFAAAGVVFLLLAENIWLQDIYPPETALAFTAGTALLLSLTAGATGVVIRKRQKKFIQRNMADILQTTEALLLSIEDEIKVPVQNNPKTALTAAAIAGFVAGEHFH